MDISIITNTISLDQLRKLAAVFYVTMIKGVVDIEQGVVAFGGEYHMDSNVQLINNGSEQKDVWGFNLYFDRPRDEWIEYTSLINIRPVVHNTSMEVEDEIIREKMKNIINSKVI